MPMARLTTNQELAQKDQLLEICPRVRLGLPTICQGLSGPGGDPSSLNTRPLKEGDKPSWARLQKRNPNKSSLHNVIQNRQWLNRTHCKNGSYLVNSLP
jgi:hypothetical protein